MHVVCERFKKRREEYCVPAAVASALSITKLDAVQRLQKIEPNSRGCYHAMSYATVLGKQAWRYPGPWRNRPTLARWLREHKREAVISAAHHAMHVKGGKVLEGNGHVPMRGRVVDVVWL